MSNSSEVVFMSDHSLARLGITTWEVVEGIEKTLQAKARGTVWTAPKASVSPGDGRYIMTTLGASDEHRVIVAKSVMFNPRNRSRGLPSINGAILLLDSETGLLRAAMDANWVTAVRTAGLSSVAAKRLANAQSTSVAFIGCGVQARSHLDAFADLFPLSRVRMFGRGTENIDRLCALADGKGLKARVCSTAREALEDADLVVSSITHDQQIEPFLDAGWLKATAFVAIIDHGIAWSKDSMSAFEIVIIDDTEQEAVRSTPMVPRNLIDGDLIGLVTQQLPRTFTPSMRSAFVFQGLAIGDIAVASLAWERTTAKAARLRSKPSQPVA